jgi:hypothetical protein
MLFLNELRASTGLVYPFSGFTDTHASLALLHRPGILSHSLGQIGEIGTVPVSGGKESQPDCQSRPDLRAVKGKPWREMEWYQRNCPRLIRKIKCKNDQLKGARGTIREYLKLCLRTKNNDENNVQNKQETGDP